jgi:hypothetical protein
MQKTRAAKLIYRLVIFLLIGLCSIVLTSIHDIIDHESLTQDVSADLTDLNILKNAYEHQQSNIHVKQNGRISKILRDDELRPRHQRFVVQLNSGQKLLIAHNIDLAPKVESLKVGTAISFFGDYEWNDKGGVVHWTHHDPKGQHPNGWLLYENRKYD